ncbi:MAG: acyl-CoA dehydrogenase family protein [Planctomycetes bacterium]|nr:acyl-CoA dehydrogenase family protein [Planctomycetota bacterium]
MSHENEKDSRQDEMIIDTSGMNKGQAQAMEVTESAREKEWQHPSFGKQLFMGRFLPEMICPFPEQSEAERGVADELIARLQPFLEEHLDPEEVDQTRTIPEKVIEGMKEMGVFAMKVPKEYGGLGFSQVNYNRVMMMLASHCGSTAVLVSAHQSIGVPQPLRYFGTEEQKQKYLPRFRAGAISAFALTEPSVGSDPAQMKTVAVPSEDGKHYIINGEKLWITNGPIADIMVLMARTPSKIVNGKERPQITAFIVEKDMPGIETAHRCDFMGIRGIQNGLIRFTEVKVPKENILLGEGKGLKLALSTLNTGRLTLPAAGAGSAKQCLAIARRWGMKRVQWGLPIGLHEVGRRKIAFIASGTFAMEAVTWLTSHWADNKNLDIRLEAAMAKLFSSEMTWQIADTTMQFCGGRGYEKSSSLAARGEGPFSVERIMRDCRINRIIEGTSEIMRLFLAREAMDPHLSLAADLIMKKVPIGRRLKALLNVTGFYARWYPAQWIHSGLWNRHENMGELACHFRFVDRASHKLARTLLHKMARYQIGLEKKQNLLAHLMEIGTELFAIAATCSYARCLSAKGDPSPTQLADLFSVQAQARIRAHYRAIREDDGALSNPLAKTVLDGGMSFLEDGILPVNRDDQKGRRENGASS